MRWCEASPSTLPKSRAKPRPTPAPSQAEADREAARVAIAGKLDRSAAEERDLVAEAAERYAGKTTREALRLMIEDTMRLASEARATGNTTAAQRCMRDVGQLTTTLARVERAERVEGDALLVPREEIATARERVREIVAKLRDRPLLCAHCSRRLSIQLAGLDPDAGETLGEGVR